MNTGDENTFLGHNSGLANTSGTKNTVLGYDAGKTMTDKSNNFLLKKNTPHEKKKNAQE